MSIVPFSEKRIRFVKKWARLEQEFMLVGLMRLLRNNIIVLQFKSF